MSCVFLCFVTFQYGVPGQVWYLNASIPDPCLPLYPNHKFQSLIPYHAGYFVRNTSSQFVSHESLCFHINKVQAIVYHNQIASLLRSTSGYTLFSNLDKEHGKT